MSLHPESPDPLPKTPSDLIAGKEYTVRTSLSVSVCERRCLTGDTHGNAITPFYREITNGTLLELHHHDPLTGHAYLTTAGETPLRVPASYLIPWE